MRDRVLLALSLAAITALAITTYAVASPTHAPTDNAVAAGGQRHFSALIEQQDAAAQVAIANTLRMEFVSKINGHRYAINVAIPFNEPPSKGYAVLYVLDGYWYFASAADLVRLVQYPTGVVVVGIGYPEDSEYTKRVLTERGPSPSYFAGMPPSRSSPFLERAYDLTLPAKDAELAEQTMPGSPPYRSRDVGGLDDFLKIIETDVKPRVAASARINQADQALFGHSLGGLAALHALFVEPGAFHTFIISSPSIWWGNKKVLADERKFASTVNNGHAQPRVFISIGGEESTPVKLPAFWGIDAATATGFTRRYRMVENTRELVASLRSLPGAAGRTVQDDIVFDKVNHGEAAWMELARAIPRSFDSDPSH